MLVVETEQRVERHHEAPLRLVPAPASCELLKLSAKRRVDLARADRRCGVTGALEAVYRLSHLSDRASVQGEGGSVDHGLVAVVKSVQAMFAVDAESGFRGAEDRNSPPARMRKAEKRSDQLGSALGRSDRITGDDRHAAHHLVGDEGPLVLVEEIGLVPAQDEWRERVRAPGCDEVTSHPAMAHFLRVPVPPGCKPVEQQDSHRAEGEEQHREWKPLAERSGQMAGSARVHSDRSSCGLAQDERK